jgi:hypothetical protein
MADIEDGEMARNSIMLDNNRVLCHIEFLVFVAGIQPSRHIPWPNSRCDGLDFNNL